MTDYAAPLADMRFVIEDLIGLAPIAALPGLADASDDTVALVLSEAGKLAAQTLAPLNQSGDRDGARLENGVVRTAEGFAEAYRAFVDGGWNGLAHDPAHGGQGLPRLVATAVAEMWSAANMAFSLCPLLTQGAVEVLAAHGGEAQKARYLGKLVSGEWTGTMCLTEPQAGTDLGAVRTRAERDGDGYRLFGTKIFITYGDHDLTENIIHMVLARSPDGPPGVKGLSLYLVPKRLVGDDGRPGAHNDITTVALEHKLGIHASPTAMLAFGDKGGARAELVGTENQGLAHMFTMMNEARLGVGMQGLAIAERAYQQALAYARERRQGRRLVDGAPARLIDHADVRRMLMVMKAETEAMRALAYRAGAALDVARRHPDAETRAAARRRVELLTPVVKAHCTDIGFEVASLGVQVHGGAGYIEETGAAQHLRDARIAMIYEGANGIQALDLARRKLTIDDGRAMDDFLAEGDDLDRRLADHPPLATMRAALSASHAALAEASRWLRQQWPRDPEAAAAGASDYLRLVGRVACGREMAEAALISLDRDDAFHRAKLATCRFYGARLLAPAAALLGPITAGADDFAALDEG